MVDTAGTSDSHPYFEIIQQFKEICAVNDDVAQMCIEEADGNLQNAIIRFLNNGTSELDRQPHSPIESQLRRRRLDYVNDSSTASSSLSGTPEPQRRQPQTDNSWIGWFGRLFSSPVYFFYNSVRQIFIFVFGLFGGFFPALTSPEEDVKTFREEIETKYSDVSVQLPWTHTTYKQALDQAKNAVRFLVVYLHNPSHQSTTQFIRDNLCTEEFKNLLEQNRTLLWGANVKTREGHMVTQALRVTTYPCVAVICMRDNTLSCVGRVCGVINRDKLIDDLQAIFNLNERFLNKILNERAQREMDTQLRRQQEEEYRRALEIDRKNVAERKRLESERLETQLKEEEEKRRLEEKAKKYEQIRENIKNKLSSIPEPTDKVVKVSVRFPSGGKYDCKFAESDTLEKLFNTVLINEKCPEDFSLLMSYPRKQLNCAPDWFKEFGTVEDGNNPKQTFKDAGLVASAVILVKDNQA